MKVTAGQLATQRSREALTHLQLPETVAGRSIIIVNSMDTLRDAARVLGFQLQSEGTSTTKSPAGSAKVSKAAKSTKKNQSTAHIDSSASANASSNAPSSDIGTSSSSSSRACSSRCGEPSVRLYVGVDAEWKATMINSKAHPTLEPGAALLQVRHDKDFQMLS